MMGYTVTIEWEGLDGAISRFSTMGEKLTNNLENQTQALGRAGKDALDAVTPVRSGRLKGGLSVCGSWASHKIIL